MCPASASSDHQIRTLSIDGQKYFVCLRVGYDGIEHVGRLRFTDAVTEITYQDHGAIPGISLSAGITKAGLPVGIELSTPPGSDHEMLAIATAIEPLLPKLPAPPERG